MDGTGTTMAAPLTLCADDYGLTAGIGRGIRRLVEAGRLSATSCMVTGPLWAEEAARLREHDGRIDIGLHLTLTDQEPAGAAPLLAPGGRLRPLREVWKLLRRAPAARAEAREQLARQLDAFTAAIGRPPDHIDGHQHVHLLPGAREAVLDGAAAIAASRAIWLRSCVEPRHWILRRRLAVAKALLLTQLGGRLQQEAQARGLAVNDSFRGVSDFRTAAVGAEFRRCLAGPGRRPLMMCHPGEVDERLARIETLVERRAVELAWLASDGFAADLAARGIVLTRLLEHPGST